MSQGNDDNKDGADDDPDIRMPNRKRKIFHGTTHHQEKWREACYRLYPNLDSLPEAQREAIESRVIVDYYIALGLNSSLPRTATSGSIETPKVSPLLQNTPRVPSRASTIRGTSARPIQPMGHVPPPLALPPKFHLQSQISPLLPVPPLAPPSPLSPLVRLAQLPREPLPQIVQPNPYLSSFYPQYRKPLITSGPIIPLQNTFLKSEEKPILKSKKKPYLKVEKALKKTTRYVKPVDDCFIKPIHPAETLHNNPFLNPPKEIRSQDTSTGDLSFKSARTSYSYSEPRLKKPKRRELSPDSTVSQLKKNSATRLDKEPSRANVSTVRKTSDDRFITPYPFFEPIEESSRQRPLYTQSEDPFIPTPDPLGSVYCPSTSTLSVPKFARSSSIYVDCPPVYPTAAYNLDLREEIADSTSNNDDSVNNNFYEDNDEPIDYSINHSSDFQP